MKNPNIYPALQMTNACNKRCSACLRSFDFEPDKIISKKLDLYINDLNELSKKFRIKNQFVTGGEPTIWKDDNKDIIDALALMESEECIESLIMPTNGRIFEDLNFTREFLKRLSQKIDQHLVIGVSIAEYQENFDDKNGCTALDNLIEVCTEPAIKAVPIILLTISKDDTLAERMRKYYPSTFQRVVPLAPLGEAEDMLDQCPSMPLTGSDKDDLGAFYPHFRNDVAGKLKIAREDFDSTDNGLIMNRLSLHNHCGSSPFIDNRWNYCLPFKEDDNYALSSIGGMDKDTIDNFLTDKPLLRDIRTNGVISMIKSYEEEVSTVTRDRIDEFFDPGTKHSVAYRGCIVCKEFFNAVVSG